MGETQQNQAQGGPPSVERAETTKQGGRLVSDAPKLRTCRATEGRGARLRGRRYKFDDMDLSFDVAAQIPDYEFVLLNDGSLLRQLLLIYHAHWGAFSDHPYQTGVPVNCTVTVTVHSGGD